MDTDQRKLGCGGSRATGLRKLTPAMLTNLAASERFEIAEELHPGEVLAAFKAAAPFLGIRPRAVHAIDWLFRFTRTVDWRPSSRPIVWPSAAMQQHDLSLGASQVKNLNRHLAELGLIVIRDSPNGKRYGRRDEKGRILEAYGFDLSPLAVRRAEFEAVAAAGRQERARVEALRRRASIARNGVRQLVEAAAVYNYSDSKWDVFCRAAEDASLGLAAVRLPDVLEAAVLTLESLRSEMHLCLQQAFVPPDQTVPAASDAVDCGPKPPDNRLHITATNQLKNPSDTVVADRKGEFRREMRSGRLLCLSQLAVEASSGPTRMRAMSAASTVPVPGTVPVQLTVSPSELCRLVPELEASMPSQRPNWHDVVNAADRLRERLGIPKSTWGEACLMMGREGAAVAVAIIATKPAGHFRRDVGAYLHGMVRRARSGQLHLDRTLWRLRAQGRALDARTAPSQGLLETHLGRGITSVPGWAAGGRDARSHDIEYDRGQRLEYGRGEGTIIAVGSSVRSG